MNKSLGWEINKRIKKQFLFQLHSQVVSVFFFPDFAWYRSWQSCGPWWTGFGRIPRCLCPAGSVWRTSTLTSSSWNAGESLRRCLSYRNGSESQRLSCLNSGSDVLWWFVEMKMLKMWGFSSDLETTNCFRIAVTLCGSLYFQRTTFRHCLLPTTFTCSMKHVVDCRITVLLDLFCSLLLWVSVQESVADGFFFANV